MTLPETIAIIGFGEVGQIFARDLHALGVERIQVFDIAFDRSDSIPARALIGAPVQAMGSAASAVVGASMIISAVTAEETLNAARSVCPGMRRGTFYLDINSASPAAKREAAALIDAAGGRYVESAVMTSVPPKGLRSPMQLGGMHAADFLAITASLKLDARVFSEILGLASALKMSRSVIIKGLEALLTEGLLTARHYGVEREVLASLSDTLPLPDWETRAKYMISRSLQHGKRRAEEMREVARTVMEAGIDPLMSAPTAIRQQRSYELGRDPALHARESLGALLDAMLAVGQAGHGDSADDEALSGSAAEDTTTARHRSDLVT
jgi:3-hydroxyisobutyrate dehydrogenase